jgi:hypothetical protein
MWKRCEGLLAVAYFKSLLIKGRFFEGVEKNHKKYQQLCFYRTGSKNLRQSLLMCLFTTNLVFIYFSQLDYFLASPQVAVTS